MTLSCDTNVRKKTSCNVNQCFLFVVFWSHEATAVLGKPADLNVAANVVCLLFRLQGLVLDKACPFKC